MSAGGTDSQAGSGYSVLRMTGTPLTVEITSNRGVAGGLGGFATPVDGVQGSLIQLANGNYVFSLANAERNYFDADGRA